MDNNDKNDASVLVRMPAELKSALMRQASINKRRITAEINVRLAASLQNEKQTGYNSGRTPTSLQDMAEKSPLTTYPNPASSAAIPIDDRPHNGTPLTDHDRTLVGLFRQLPPEKQLSLLTLLRP